MFKVCVWCGNPRQNRKINICDACQEAVKMGRIVVSVGQPCVKCKTFTKWRDKSGRAVCKYCPDVPKQETNSEGAVK